jgi:hypothetical protein
MKQWFYYIIVYYKYIHGSFNINNEIYHFKNFHKIKFEILIII